MNKQAETEVEVLFDEERIARRNQELAREIAEANPSDPLIVPILKGSFIFAADLIRALHQVGIHPEIEFVSVSSYGAGTSPKKPKLTRDLQSDPKGRDVLLVDDILESGNTLSFVRDMMLERGASSVKTIVLLEKPGKRKTDIEADYTGFSCPDRFVVGYGMDSGHRFRALPFVGVEGSRPVGAKPPRGDHKG